MFVTEPKIIEEPTSIKKGQKNRESSMNYFNKITENISQCLISLDKVIELQSETSKKGYIAKPQDVASIKKGTKDTLRDLKEAQKFLVKYKILTFGKKKGENVQEQSADRKPTGLQKKKMISDKFAAIFDLDKNNPEENTQSRNSVTKIINNYIGKNELQGYPKRNIINYDENLRQLFQISPDSTSELTYAKYQKYLHFCFEPEPEQKPKHVPDPKGIGRRSSLRDEPVPLSGAPRVEPEPKPKTRRTKTQNPEPKHDAPVYVEPEPKQKPKQKHRHSEHSDQ